MTSKGQNITLRRHLLSGFFLCTLITIFSVVFSHISLQSIRSQFIETTSSFNTVIDGIEKQNMQNQLIGKLRDMVFSIHEKYDKATLWMVQKEISQLKKQWHDQKTTNLLNIIENDLIAGKRRNQLEAEYLQESANSQEYLLNQQIDELNNELSQLEKTSFKKLDSISNHLAKIKNSYESNLNQSFLNKTFTKSSMETIAKSFDILSGLRTEISLIDSLVKNVLFSKDIRIIDDTHSKLIASMEKIDKQNLITNNNPNRNVIGRSDMIKLLKTDLDSFQKDVARIVAVQKKIIETNLKITSLKADVLNAQKQIQSTIIEKKSVIEKAFFEILENIGLYDKYVISSAKEAKNRFNSMVETNDELIRKRGNFQIILCIFSVVIALSISIFITRSITAPVEKVEKLSKLLTQGNLRHNIAYKRNDEIGRLLYAMNIIIMEFRSVVESSKNRGKQVADASKTLLASAGSLKDNSEQISNQANNVTSAAVDIFDNFNRIANSSHQMSQSLKSLSETSTAMLENIDSVTSAIEEMSMSMNAMGQHAKNGSHISDRAMTIAKRAKEIMNALGEAAKKIDGVTHVIKRIAHKTNLLALNAAIEANAAGEAGLGFAVVANEIQLFADQSSQAAEDIARRISKVQENTTEAASFISDISLIIKEMSVSSEQIAKSVQEQIIAADDIAKNSVEANIRANGITDSINDLAKAANDVSDNVAEVAISSNEVSQNIQGIGQAIVDNNQTIRQVHNSAKELDTLAQGLHRLVDKYQV